MTSKQKAIINYLHYIQNTITLSEAVEIIGKNIYANKERYVSLAMARMVKKGLIKRIKLGLFELNGPQEKQGDLL